MKVSMSDLAHELWSAAQLAPGEGIEDGVRRIEAILLMDSERQREAIARQFLAVDPLT